MDDDQTDNPQSAIRKPQCVAPPDAWQRLRQLTPARIALGRAGGSLPTAELLDFQLAHARARDAVAAPLDIVSLKHEIEQLGLRTTCVTSAAGDHLSFLQRPDLGRRLSDEGRATLARASEVGWVVFADKKVSASQAEDVSTASRAGQSTPQAKKDPRGRELTPPTSRAWDSQARPTLQEPAAPRPSPLAGEGGERGPSFPSPLAGEGRERGPDIAVIVSAGLSALAAQRQVAAVLSAWLPLVKTEGWALSPVVLVEFGRVALEDEIGSLLGAKAALILIGERPGLGSPDSLGAYLVYAPRVGRTDAQRNCISNIRPEGLPPTAAAVRIHHLLREALRLQISGVQLKDESIGPTTSDSPQLAGGDNHGPSID